MKKFDQELAEMRQQVIRMGNLAESMVNKAVTAITDPHDESIFSELFEDEAQLDQMQLDIDRDAIRVLTMYSPVAANLRFVLSVSRISLELERIGDHAMNIGESVQLFAARSDVRPLSEITRMARVVREMVRDALNAFLHYDSRAAHSTIARDDMVDALNDQIVKELLSDEVVREAISGPVDIAGALAQMMLARSLERIADQATNISEEVIYAVRGCDVRHQSLDTPPLATV